MPDLILKADSYDKQAAKWRKLNDLSDLSLTHILMPKYDGCHAIIDTTTCEVTSREGKPVRSMGLQAVKVRELMGPGWVIQGEAWHPGWHFPDISGAFRRHEQGPLHFVAYNAMAREEFAAGFSPTPYQDRLNMLLPMRRWAARARGWLDVYTTDIYRPGTYANIERMAREFKDQEGPYDGVILADPNAPWQAGRSRNGELIKVKPEVSLDVRCVSVGTAVGEKTGRTVYTLTVQLPNGQLNEVGSGMPHTVNPEDYIGKIVEVEAMGWTPDGFLREPRFKTIRHDKEEPDT